MKSLFYCIYLILFSIYCNAQNSERSYMVEIPISNISPAKDKFVFFNAEECRQSYYKINLPSFDVVVEKNFLRKYRPIALIKIETGGKKYYKILGNEAIEFNSQTNTIRTVKNTTVLDNTPYMGDEITITVALYKERTKDRIAELFSLVTDLSTLVPIIPPSYTEITQNIYKKIDGYFANTEPLISYKNTFKSYQNNPSANAFKEGFYLLTKQEVSPEELSYKNDEFIISKASQGGHKLDYVLLNFEHNVEIPNYQTKDFYKRFKEALKFALNKDEKMAMGIFKDEVLPKIYADDNLTSNNKNILHRNFYSQLAEIFMSYNDKFEIEHFPKIPCFIRNVSNSMVLGNPSKEELWKIQNRDQFNDLMESVKLDKRINEAYNMGKFDANEFINEDALR